MSSTSQVRVGQLQRGVFKLLLDQPEGLPAKEIISGMVQVVPATDFEKSDYPKHPGIQRFGKMIRFATIAPVKAGWMVKEKGKWYLTEEGKSAYARYQDPEEFNREARRLFDQWANKQPKEVADAEEEFHEEIGTTERVADASSTLEEAEETAWDEIEAYVQAINPYDLQKLVAALLRAMKYHVAWISPPGPDKGIDILAYNDPLVTGPPPIRSKVREGEKKTNEAGRGAFRP